MFEKRELELSTTDNLIELTDRGDIDWKRGKKSNVLFYSRVKDWIIEIRSRRREVFIEGRREGSLSFCIREQGNNQRLVEKIRDKKRSETEGSRVDKNEKLMDEFLEKLKSEL